MLPSTGYFKAINCPFYENGYCERPYCHFKHSRRDQSFFQKDGASTSAAVTSESSQTIQKSQDASTTAAVAAANPKVIEQLVSEAVKKVLADQNVTDTENIVSKVVEGLKPNLVSTVLSSAQSAAQKQDGQSIASVSTSLSAPVAPTGKSSSFVYNPTPIAELRKRHIPVSYELTRESKAVKRKSPDVDSPWMDVIRNINIVKERKHKVRYKPTAISQINASKESHSYGSAPYDISSAGNNVYVRERKKKKEFYQPKPKKRREEYVPRKPKVPLKHDQSLEDDSFDLDDDIACESEPDPSAVIDEESQDLMEIDPNYSDDERYSTITKSVTKEKENSHSVHTKTLFDKKDNSKESKKQDDQNSQNHKSSEKSLKNDDSKKNNEDVTKSQTKSSEKSSKDDTKSSKDDTKSSKDESKSNKEDGKHSSKHKDKNNEDFKAVKIKEEKEDWRDVKIKEEPRDDVKEENSKHSKSRDKDRGDEKRDKDKGDEKRERTREKEKSKEKDREKDKHKHSSKSSDKERSSSSSSKDKSKDKEKDRDKDRRDSKDSRESSSHRSSKKEIKTEKDRRSSSRDLKDSHRDSKDREKSKHKSDDKSSSHRSKSSSSDVKSKSNKHSSKDSEKRSSHSSHKSDKQKEKISVEREIVEKEISDSDEHDEKSDLGDKCDSPEYEEFSPMFDEQLLEDSDSDHDVEAECRKIFQEYKVTDHPKEVIGKTAKPEVEETEDDLSKKRVAHSAAAVSLTKPVGPSQPLKRLQNPQQKMYERWRMMREVAAEKAAEKAAISRAAEVFLQKKSENSDHPVNGNGRIRIAQVPYAMSLALEKKKVLELAAKIESKTVAQTKKGGVARVAHIPQTVPQLIRPEPMQSSGTQKFPLNVRQFYVNAMQDICTQIYTNSEDAAQRALREELSCYERCKALNVYKNSCMLTVHRLRKEVDQRSTEEVTASYSGLISHEAVLAGKVKGTYSVIKQKKMSDLDFKGPLLYKMLTKWILSEQELKDNGFPRPHPDGSKGRAKLYTSNKRGQSTTSKVPNQRYCCRCNKPYMVDKHGLALRKENCIYHYARKFTFRGESKYMCCKQDATSDGCCDASNHVWDFVDAENLRGYVSTLDKDISDEKQGLFALDCEMCYTTQGLELTRVTVINEKLEVVYEALVKPSHPIIDYNTRFSGISENDMKNVTTTLIEVQATLLSIFSSKTILIGHSLESDFKALKLLHDTVVDTSVMFPHKNGPPFKRALKNLCSEHLRKIIQNDVGGHDSKEDAIACMELVLWKVKEEAKLQ